MPGPQYHDLSGNQELDAQPSHPGTAFHLIISQNITLTELAKVEKIDNI